MSCHHYFTKHHVFKNIEDFPMEAIDIRDIATALSKICRFNGFMSGFYSVAEHSCLTMELLELMQVPRITPALELATLLHDAEEAYVGDIIRPVLSFVEVNKIREIGFVKDIGWLQSHFSKLICQQFDYELFPEDWAIVNKADNLMLQIEGDLFYGIKWDLDAELRSIATLFQRRIRCLEWKQAYEKFMGVFGNVYTDHVEAREVASGQS